MSDNLDGLKAKAERSIDSLVRAIVDGIMEAPDEEILADALSEALGKIRTRIKMLEEALQPFAAACTKADASSEEVRRAGMGNGHSDDATPGWGIRYKHLKAARAALTAGEK